MGFTDVVTGQPTLASNVNQLVDALNGTVASGVTLLATANNAAILTLNSPSVPASDNAYEWINVSGDSTSGRVALGIRSTGYGGIWLGHGGTAAWDAIFYGVSGGSKTDQNFTVGGSFTSTGSATLGGLVSSGSTSLDGGAITTNGSGSLTASLFYATGHQFSLNPSSMQGEAANALRIVAANGGVQPDLELHNDGNGYVVIKSGSQHVSLRNTAGNSTWDIYPDSSWCHYEAQGSGNLGHRFFTNGQAVAHFGQRGDTYNLVVSGGFQYGSGNADDAELVWGEDRSLRAGEVVCWTDAGDEGFGGLMVRCAHDDCPGAGVVSSQPASAKGGRVLRDEESGHFEYDTDPRWKPRATEGRVPVFVIGDPDAYPPNTRLTSAGDGRARKMRAGDASCLGVVVSRRSDVGGRPLPPGAVLALVG